LYEQGNKCRSAHTRCIIYPIRKCNLRNCSCYPKQSKVTHAQSTLVMGTMAYIPRKSTLLLLFDKPVWRLVDNSDGSQLSDARLVAATEELNRIADEIRDASMGVSTHDDAATRPS